MAWAVGVGGPAGFVGRTRELSLLDAQLAEVRLGAPRLVLIEGPPGIGKSTLLRRVMADAEDFRVLRSSGDEAESRLPFGVIGQLARSAGTARWPDGEPAPGEDPLVVGVELLHVLGTLEAAGPLAVVVDDAHWADRPSLQALSFALRRLQADRVLAVVLGREEELTLPDGLRRLADERGVRLRLEGLEVEDLAALDVQVAGEHLSRRELERLRQHTGGNPLHVHAVLADLDRPTLGWGDRPLPAPRPFAAEVVSRLGTCSADARRFIQAASVLGQRCPVGLAARVASLEQPAGALDEAVAAGLVELVEAGAGPVVVFTHPLIRAAIYHDLRPAQGVELHSQASSFTDGSIRLDHRIAAALVEDPVLAAEVAAHGRQEVVRGATISAAAYLVTASRLSADRAERERLLLDALEQLLLSGEAAEAARLVEDVQALPDSTRRRYLLGHLALLSGRRRDAEDFLSAAWARCEQDPDDELGPLVCLALAQLCSTELRMSEAVNWSQRVIGPTANPALTAPALGVLVPCLGAAGRAEEGLSLAASLPDGRAAPLGVPDIDGVLGRGLVRMWVDDLLGARADLLAVVLATRRRPACASGLIALGFLAEAEYRLGAWDDSIAHGDLAVSLARDSDQVWLTAFVHASATWALAARGSWEAAQAHVEGALTTARLLGDPASVTCAAMAGAHLAFSRSDHAAVLDAVGPLLDLEQSASVAEPSVHPWRELHADALVNLGRLDEAEEALDVLLALARDRNSSLCHATRVRAALQVARGDADGARATFEAALDHCQHSPAPFDRALLRLAYGRFLRRSGERRAAAAHLVEADRVFGCLRAEPFLATCQAELAACGLTARARSALIHPADLTPQELAVAKLVVAGASNREVAAQLVVSVKTVEYHMGNLFSKLGITSRRQLPGCLAGPEGPDPKGAILEP